MSLVEELIFFLGLQIKEIKETKEQIHIHQTKYAQELLIKFGMENDKELSIPMATSRKIDMTLKVSK